MPNSIIYNLKSCFVFIINACLMPIYIKSGYYSLAIGIYGRAFMQQYKAVYQADSSALVGTILIIKSV